MYLKNFFILFLFVQIGFSGNNSSLQKTVDSFNNSDALRHAQWGLYAEFVDSGEALLQLNANKSLAPASGLKLFTSAVALETLGPDFQFETSLYQSGMISKGGRLLGNLIIQGSGDPTLGSGEIADTLPLEALMQNWVEIIENAGITQIDGSILSDGTLFEDKAVPGNWLWIDLGNYYGTGVDALSINDNLYHIFFSPGRKPGLAAAVRRTEPTVPGLIFKNQMLTGAVGSGDNGYIYRGPNSNIATLRGTIPAGVKEFSIKGSLPDPALFTAGYLREKLLDAGINVLGTYSKVEDKPAYENLTLLDRMQSPKLSKIIERLNKRSVNHYAEQLLFTLSVDSIGVGKREIGLACVKKFLEKNQINTDPLSLQDGSGLSPNNMISAKMMVELLSRMKRKPNFEVFYESLSLAGDTGDIGFFKKFGQNTVIEKKCRIKSGLIEGVRSHSGYLITQSGRMIAFSFIANHLKTSFRKIDNIHKELLIQLAKEY